mgnify:CR=1 FL=1
MMTFDTGAFESACQHGAKPRAAISDDEEPEDTIAEVTAKLERLKREKENREAQRQEQVRRRADAAKAKKAQASRTAGGARTLNSGRTENGTGGVPGVKAPRGRVRVNPVTGAMEQIAASDKDDDPNYVREGCMKIHKKYMNAAVAAGLGGGNGMYGHIGGMNKMLNSDKNTGGRPRDGRTISAHAAASQMNRGKKSGSMITTKTTTQGGLKIHQVSSKTANPTRKKLVKNPNFDRRATGACDLGGNLISEQKKKSNIKMGVGGKTRSVRQPGMGARKEATSYGQMKGVVNGIHGSTSAATQRYQAEKQDREANQFGGGSKVVTKPRRAVQTTTNTLGGSKAAGGGDGMTDRERRAAFFEKKFGKQ